MNNFELIDDYLANRLNETDRKSFELQLNGDPSLKADVDLQRQIVEGVRRARAAELKSMLKNVPVNGNSWSTGKTLVSMVAAGIVATSLYLYLQEDQPEVSESPLPSAPARQEPAAAEVKPTEEPVAKDEDVKKETTTTVPEQKADKKKSAEPVVKTPAVHPDIQVVDPSEELVQSDNNEPSSPGSRPEVTASKMEVSVNSTDKKYTFHYQFVQGKLMLFGPFDKTLYEVLEINSDSHAVFLFYRENYYLLDESQQKATALTAIRDTQLLKKLKEYRGR